MGNNLIPLVQAVHEATGRKPALSTVIRWIVRGCRGKRLEAKRLGGRWFTSTDAVLRFMDDSPAPRMNPTKAAERLAKRVGVGK